MAKAKVYILSRNEKKATEAIARMKESAQGAKDINVNFIRVDLQSLASVQAAAEEFKRRESRLDILINNAGVRPIVYFLFLSLVQVLHVNYRKAVSETDNLH